MIRVLQVFGGLDCGGAETMLMNLYRNIDRNQVQFDFIKHTSKKCFYEDEILKLGGKIYLSPKYSVLNHFKYKKWWGNFFDKHPEYKILHSHVRSTATIIMRVAQQKGLKTISHSHSTSDGNGIKAYIKKILRKNIVKYSDYCFACSKESGQWLFGRDITDSNKFKVLPNAIDTRLYKFNQDKRWELRKKYGIEDDFVIGHVGRFSNMKNHSFLIDIFNCIQKEKNNSKLVLIGDGDLRSEIEEKVKRLDLTDQVLFLGVQANVFEFLNIFDCFVFPSIWEGLPVSLVEAQANGLPVLASDNITDEVMLTPLIKKQSLNDGANIWAQEAMSLKRDSANYVNRIVEAGYDIQESASNIQKFYLNLL